jgi:hypothetical protein
VPGFPGPGAGSEGDCPPVRCIRVFVINKPYQVRRSFPLIFDGIGSGALEEGWLCDSAISELVQKGEGQVSQSHDFNGGSDPVIERG